MTEALARLLSAHQEDTEIVFAPGTYCFSAENAAKRAYSLSNSNPAPYRNCSILLENSKNLTLDFCGSKLLFSGQTIPLALDQCRNITIKNASIDWDIPFSAEAEIVQTDREQITVSVDPTAYPHHVKDGKLYFTGPGWEYPYFAAMEFEREGGFVRPGAGDTFPKVSAEEKDERHVVLKGKFDPIPRVGNRLVLRHGERVHSGAFCQDSDHISFEDLTFYSTCGLGALFQFCGDLKLHRVSFMPNYSRGRHVLSGHDDGLHLSNCRGHIDIDRCRFAGLMDDPINVHGTSARITSIEGHVLEGSFCHPQSIGFSQWAKGGDVISLLDKSTMDSVGTVSVKSYTLCSSTTFRIEVEQDLPKAICAGDAMENLTNTPSVCCTHSYFGPCRARGFLVSTPQKVEIKENHFDSSGAAILLSGDANEWYESGACKDVTISGNLFSAQCMTSEYQFCEGVITLYPEIKDKMHSKGFHENIRITDNTFFYNGKPLLYAHCTNNLEFSKNTILPLAEGPYVKTHFTTLRNENNLTIG